MATWFRFTKLRDVKSPCRWTAVSSWIDFFIPNDLKVEDIKFTPMIGKHSWELDPIHLVDEKEKKIYIPAWAWVLIPSWLKVLMGWDVDWTYEMVLYNKSWVAVKYNLLVWANVIDNDYRGEFNIHLINPTTETVIVEFWQKIVQWIIRKVYLPEPEEISNEEYELNSNTERGEGWFGSTWTK